MPAQPKTREELLADLKEIGQRMEPETCSKERLADNVKEAIEILVELLKS